MQLHHCALLRLWSGLLCVLLPAQVARAEFEGVKIETVPVAPGLHMLVGQGGNIGGIVHASVSGS
jgi:hypothetical protein